MQITLGYLAFFQLTESFLWEMKSCPDRVVCDCAVLVIVVTRLLLHLFWPSLNTVTRPHFLVALPAEHWTALIMDLDFQGKKTVDVSSSAGIAPDMERKLNHYKKAESAQKQACANCIFLGDW